MNRIFQPLGHVHRVYRVVEVNRLVVGGYLRRFAYVLAGEVLLRHHLTAGGVNQRNGAANTGYR